MNVQIPVLDEFIRLGIQQSSPQCEALLRAALRLEGIYSSCQDRAHLRRRSARFLIVHSRRIVADITPVVNSLQSHNATLGHLAHASLTYSPSQPEVTRAQSPVPEGSVDPIVQRVQDTIGEAEELATILQKLMKRIERLLAWAVALLWELSVDAERWEHLYSAQSGAVATLAALLGGERVMERSMPEMERDVMDDVEHPLAYRELLAHLPAEDNGSTLDDDDDIPSMSEFQVE
jgi:hypothetical protein